MGRLLTRKTCGMTLTLRRPTTTLLLLLLLLMDTGIMILVRMLLLLLLFSPITLDHSMRIVHDHTSIIIIIPLLLMIIMSIDNRRCFRPIVSILSQMCLANRDTENTHGHVRIVRHTEVQLSRSFDGPTVGVRGVRTDHHPSFRNFRAPTRIGIARAANNVFGENHFGRRKGKGGIGRGSTSQSGGVDWIGQSGRLARGDRRDNRGFERAHPKEFAARLKSVAAAGVTADRAGRMRQ